MSIHDIEVTTIDGARVALSEYAGKALLIVNVASRCGYTPQYAGLERLYQAERARGLEVLGFPCNQFGRQEPGTEAEIKSFCETKYDVHFPMFAKIEVNGPSRHPLYAALTAARVGPDPAGDVGWNFAKFLVGPDGEIRARFSPDTKPEDPELLEAIRSSLVP